MVRTKNTLSFTALLADLSATIEENGFIKAYVLVLPNFTTAASAILSIIDTDGHILYTGDSKNKNATYVVTGLDIPMGYGYTAKLTLNAASGGAHDAIVKLYIKKE